MIIILPFLGFALAGLAVFLWIFNQIPTDGPNGEAVKYAKAYAIGAPILGFVCADFAAPAAGWVFVIGVLLFWFMVGLSIYCRLTGYKP